MGIKRLRALASPPSRPCSTEGILKIEWVARMVGSLRWGHKAIRWLYTQRKRHPPS